MRFVGEGFVELSEESIFRKINEYDIFSYYIPEFKELGKKFSSPFRSDGSPSCVITKYNGTFFFRDFGTDETYTAINFVKAKFNADYYEALSIISADFNLGLHDKTIDKASMGYVGIPNVPIKGTTSESSEIRIKRREWNDNIDKEYWSQYGLNRAILKHFNVHPIQNLWINGKVFNINDKNPSYAYVLGEGEYKILSPYNEEFKWLNNCKNTIQGYTQLPDKGELLVITSSYKDVMSLYKYGYNAIAPQSENTMISSEMMEELKERFSKIIVFFDNDSAGITAANIYNELYNIEYVHTPVDEPKDISDYYKKYGDEQTREILRSLL
jgi:hypothetical protein